MASGTVLISIKDISGSRNGRTLVYNKEDLGGSIPHAMMFVAEVANKINTPIQIMQSKEILGEQGIEIFMKHSGDAMRFGDTLEDIV